MVTIDNIRRTLSSFFAWLENEDYIVKSPVRRIHKVKATKKVKGAKTSIKLIKNSARVANICADVIGDICGVLSGAISAMIASKITEKFGVNLQFVISAMVASLTVGGKALGKEVANNNSTPIVHFVGTFLNKFHK